MRVKCIRSTCVQLIAMRLQDHNIITTINLAGPFRLANVHDWYGGFPHRFLDGIQRKWHAIQCVPETIKREMRMSKNICVNFGAYTHQTIDEKMFSLLFIESRMFYFVIALFFSVIYRFVIHVEKKRLKISHSVPIDNRFHLCSPHFRMYCKTSENLSKPDQQPHSFD